MRYDVLDEKIPKFTLPSRGPEIQEEKITRVGG